MARLLPGNEKKGRGEASRRSAFRSVWVRLAASLVLIGILVFMLRHQVSATFAMLREISLAYYAAGMLINFAMVYLLGWRFAMIMRRMEVGISVWRAFVLTLIGRFANSFLPTTIAEDVAKGALLWSAAPQKRLLLTGIVGDRLIGIVVMLGMALVVSPALPGREAVYVAPLLVLAIAVIAGLPFLAVRRRFRSAGDAGGGRWYARRLLGIGEKIRESLACLVAEPGMLLRAVGVSAIANVGGVVSTFFFAKSLGVTADLIDLLVYVPLIAVISMLPSINGLGFREMSYVMFFSQRWGAETAFAISLMALSSVVATALAGGIAFAFWRARERRG